MNLLVYRKRDYFGTYGASCIYKIESLHGSRLHIEYCTGTHRICRCHALYSADILLYGPDMAKAVINVICWLVCAYLMVKKQRVQSIKRTGTHHSLHAIGIGAGIYLYICGRRILVPVYGLLIVGVALKIFS